jgi:small subunit ribosomal protein S1
VAKSIKPDASSSTTAVMYEATLKNIAEGTIVPGKIVSIRENEVLVDIGYKSEGVIFANEFKDLETLKPGDQVEVFLETLEDEQGMVVLSKRRAEQQRNWDRVLANYVEGSTIMGTIKGRVKGGMIVDVGVDAFLPGSQVDVMPMRGGDDLMERELEFKIIKINRERRNIVVSRRELMEERRREQKKLLLSDIKIGEMRRGVVKNITDFGAFVDLNGMDGLLHITDMSWGRINHPSEVVKVGQEIDVMILDVDREKDRISLGLKQNLPNPWDDIERKYPVGTRISGKIVNLVPYGAFVEIEEGVEGMVHVSEISWTKRVAKASDALALGQVVDAVILNINKDEQKISLGIRQTEANPWMRVQERYPIGSRVKGVVRNFTSYGAFVELEPGIDGMIHVSDMSWTRKVNHPSEVLKKADEVEAVVLEVDPAQQRISLGLKQAQHDPWSSIAGRYQVGQLVKGKVSKLASFGAFVEIEEGRVIKIDAVERRIGLSIKAAKLSDEEFKVDESMLEGLRPGEDLVDLAGAFDEAFGSTSSETEEWHPGQKK